MHANTSGNYQQTNGGTGAHPSRQFLMGHRQKENPAGLQKNKYNEREVIPVDLGALDRARSLKQKKPCFGPSF